MAVAGKGKKGSMLPILSSFFVGQDTSMSIHKHSKNNARGKEGGWGRIVSTAEQQVFTCPARAMQQ